MKMWERMPEQDKRVANGDDYAGDAWRHITSGEIKYTAVNHGPPKPHSWPIASAIRALKDKP